MKVLTPHSLVVNLGFLEELEMLELQLEQRENEMEQLKEALNRSTHDADDSQTKNKVYAGKMKETQEKIKDLHTELYTKDNLVRTKFDFVRNLCNFWCIIYDLR